MSTFVLARIEAIQQELEELKKVVSHQEPASVGRKTKLKGLWAGVYVSEEDIDEAQKAVFKEVYCS